MKNPLCFAFLYSIKWLTRLFYRHEVSWVEPPPERWWEGIHLVALLTHTSLMEPVFLGGVENGLIRRLAEHGLVPVADKTANRPIVGRIFRLFAPEVVPITRRRDHTWDAIKDSIDDESMVVILPEGRMRRADGLDSQGKPMTVRGGVADLLAVVPDGRLLFAYSGGLHHVQIPGEGFPRLFKKVRLRFELTEIGEYRDSLGFGQVEPRVFKQNVIADMTRRRDLHSPIAPGTLSMPASVAVDPKPPSQA